MGVDAGLVLGAFLVAGFLLGSIPTGYMIARARGIDLRGVGSGNIGATNLGRVLGARWFVLCTILDALKGLAPTVAFGVYAGLMGGVPAPADALAWIAVMLAPILGHVFCPWLGFKGGKGVATGLGSLLGVFPVLTLAAAVALAAWLIVFARTRIISLASLVAGFAITPGVLLAVAGLARINRQDPLSMVSLAWPFTVLGVCLAAFVAWTHRANITRLRAGTEAKYVPKRDGAAGTSAAPSEPAR